ncbi:ATP-dependent DNA helicase RecG [Oribacterium sp. C9]|uniref:ATP-dependent DNA helicase RecG n=1 Tax=Oribacterium sp. C9 TaxID=1943579 RepID=UPI00098F1583|nr:ATP-dependent DNA helicase RecG [Oribacterium sp. C9]OON87212.1 ATP-dependent DNA helicase RecG [Oribacterium sp. C9]
MTLTDLKGIGPKTEKLFNKLGIFTVRDLLYYFPHTYLCYKKPLSIGNLTEGETEAVTGMLEKDAVVVNLHGLRMTSAYIRDISGKMRLTWFNAPFLRNTLKAGSAFVFFGKVGDYKGQKTLNQPKIFSVDEYAKKIDTLEPVYGQSKGLSNAVILKAIRQAMEVSKPEADFIPEVIRYNRELLSMNDAIRHVHFPENMEDYKKARERLAYNELFLFSMALVKKKQNTAEQKSDFIIKRDERIDSFIKALPFTLTEGQASAVEDIRSDLSGGFTMNRLLQGDVGSGKTIVSFIAALETAFNGHQAAIMAPTEILAAQHYEKLKKIVSDNAYDLKIALVTGSLKVSEKKAIYKEIENHEADIIIGTHALFQENVIYDDLALVVTDEQHRFGVNQRKTLGEKGKHPHTLVMSATPIPRTLAMLLYADMKVSLIKGLPSNRLPIKNAVVNESYRNKAYKFIYDEIKKGRQAYIICPMVEDNDMLDLENVTDYTAKIRKLFPAGVKIEKLHGKMKPKEKDDIMDRFLHKEIDILVSTTVVEVGVDVPNSTVMMVENAERFGLAQLHQLRGRVGRSEHQSFCIFVDSSNSDKSKERLQILANSNDGFHIAEEDLRLRGPGDIFGIRQSGALDFSIADIYQDKELLKKASEDAMYVLRSDSELKETDNQALKDRLNRYLEESYVL